MRPYTLRPLARRRLLSNLIAHTRCPRLHPLTPAALVLAPPPPVPLPTHQHRTFWSRNKPNSHETTPGIGPIERLVGSLDTQEGRPPPDGLLVESFRQLVATWRGTAILDEHAHGLARTYEYLRTSPRGVAIPPADLRAALAAVHHGTSAHQVGLARVLFNAIASSPGETPSAADTLAFITALARSGNTAEAAEVAGKYAALGGVGEASGVGRGEQLGRAWELILRGFAREGDEETLLHTWHMVLRSGAVEVSPGMYHPMVKFYCRRKDLDTAGKWYDDMLGAGLVPRLRTSVELMRLCVEVGSLERGQSVLDTVLAGGRRDPEHELETTDITAAQWDEVLQWSAVMGRGLERVDYLLDTMARISEKDKARPAPDINTINGLIKFGISRKDTAMVEHFLRLAVTKGFEYNRWTLELQIEYQLLMEDVEGARKAYEELRREHIPKTYEAREAKHLLRTLCRDPARDMEKIRQVYLDLNDWKVGLDVETLTALLNVFLEKCIFQDVIELLQRDCSQYTARDRRKVIHEIGEYIGRDTTSIEAAWDSYQILYQLFPELSVRQRTDIMRLFFELGRSDMATLVFQHMRGNPGRRPDSATYTLAFMGVAYARDLDALKAIHNALKLDQLVDPNTLLTNALMAAYSHCGIPERALQFWEEIKKSREGPDHASISIFLDACGQMWDGSGIKLAKIVWGQLRAMGVRPTLGNYCSYIEALGRRGFWNDSLLLAKRMETLDGVKPDLKLLGTLYATSPQRAEIQEWARSSYPTEWAECEARLVALPEGLSGEEILEQLGIGQLQRLTQQSRRVAGKPEDLAKELPVYTRA